MKFNFKVIAAAGALVASSAVSAQVSSLDRMATQNGSLIFLGLNTSGPVSFLANLNFNLNDFLPTSATNAPGTVIQWNFNNNSLTVNNVAQTGNFLWSNPFATFAAVTGGTTQWAVISGDSVSGLRFTTTGNPNQGQIDSLSNLLASGMGTVNALYASSESLGTHPCPGGVCAPNTAGANTATSGDPYVGGLLFGADGRWRSNLTYSAFANAGTSNRFQFINVLANPTVTTYGVPNVTDTVADGLVSTFEYNNGVLTWAVPVPEPGTYAMLIAGLAALGFMVRRRRSS